MTDQRGLYLLIKPTGGQLWRWNYRHKGVQKTMSFGQYPDVPLATARERQAEARKILSSGVDPMQKRKADRANLMVSDTNNFQSVALLWMDHWKIEKSKQHVDSTRRRLEANVYPILGAHPIAD